MNRAVRYVGGLATVIVVLVAGLYAYRSLMLWDGRTPEGYEVLTAVPDAAGFEPANLPSVPVLENQSADDFAVNFGYKVSNIPYSYSMVLTFPPGSEKGRATVVARHATRSASVEGDVLRRWDEPRHAYSVALKDGFNLEPMVPSLCIKAVVGPSLKSYELKNGSICIAQRDAAGNCHPETLACGLIR